MPKVVLVGPKGVLGVVAREFQIPDVRFYNIFGRFLVLFHKNVYLCSGKDMNKPAKNQIITGVFPSENVSDDATVTKPI